MHDDTDRTSDYVTATVGGQLFGLPILRVQDVFVPERVTPVPLAPPEIAGVLNLRGRIVTVIDLRMRLGLGRGSDDARPIAIGVEAGGESYGLLIDAVGEVLTLDDKAREDNPANLDRKLAAVSTGIYRLDGALLVTLDLDRILDLDRALAVA